MSDVKIVPLRKLIAYNNEDGLASLLSDFDSPNDDINEFLAHKAIQFEKTDVARTSLVMANYRGTLKIAGYFSLVSKSLIFDREEWNSFSNSQKKRLRPLGGHLDKMYYDIPSILLGQLGRNFKYNLITGSDLLGHVYETVKRASMGVAVRILYLEAQDLDCLTDFYTRNGFSMLQVTNDSGKREPYIRKESNLHLFVKQVDKI